MGRSTSIQSVSCPGSGRVRPPARRHNCAITLPRRLLPAVGYTASRERESRSLRAARVRRQADRHGHSKGGDCWRTRHGARPPTRPHPGLRVALRLHACDPPFLVAFLSTLTASACCCPPSVRPSLQDGMFQNEFQRAYVGDGGALSMPPACRPASLLAAHGQTARVNDGRRPLPLPPLPPRFACLAHPKLPVCSVRMWIHSRNHAGGQGTALLCSVLFCAARIDARAASRQPSLFPSHADHHVSCARCASGWLRHCSGADLVAEF